MEIRTLRSFLAVAREGNVTRAARLLHITQPALSRQLSELEREMGCALLIREPRGVTLTDEGMHLRKRADEIVSLADRTELELRSPVTEIEGDVWVGGGETRTMELVARTMRGMSAQHPGVRLRLHSGNADDVIERVDKGLLDFGLIIGRQPDSRFESLLLPGHERWGILVRRDDPLASLEQVSTEQLAGRRLIVSDQSEDAGTPPEGLERILGAVSGQVVATYTLLYNASLLVEQDVGIALCLDGIVSPGEGTPFAFVPTTTQPTIETHLIWKRFVPQSRACELFLRELRACCGEV